MFKGAGRAKVLQFNSLLHYSRITWTIDGVLKDKKEERRLREKMQKTEDGRCRMESSVDLKGGGVQSFNSVQPAEMKMIGAKDASVAVAFLGPVDETEEHKGRLQVFAFSSARFLQFL